MPLEKPTTYILRNELEVEQRAELSWEQKEVDSTGLLLAILATIHIMEEDEPGIAENDLVNGLDQMGFNMNSCEERTGKKLEDVLKQYSEQKYIKRIAPQKDTSGGDVVQFARYMIGERTNSEMQGNAKEALKKFVTEVAEQT